METTRITSIGRPVDPAWPTNQAILILSLTVLLVVAAFRIVFGGLAFLPALVAGSFAGGSVFLAWAFARELDPDHDLAAFVGALIALPAWELLGSPGFTSLVLLLLGLRIVNRTVGPPARPLDSIASAMCSNGTSSADSISGATLCIVLVHRTMKEAPACSSPVSYTHLRAHETT